MADNNNSRVSMAIRVLVILGIAFFAVDEFYLKNQTPELTTEEIQAKLAKTRKNRAEKLAKAKTEKEAKEKAKKAALENNQSPDEKKSTEEGNKESELPPVENVNIIEKNEQVQPESLDSKIDKLSENIPIEENVIKKESNDSKIKNEPEDQLTKNTNVNLDSNSVEEIKIPSLGNKSEESMTSKIVETLIETPPPSYDQIGRGLVYNCKGKYWACVDKATYLICNKNFKYNESVGKDKECVTQSIYASDDDCAKVQKYNVSVNQSTDFCKN